MPPDERSAAQFLAEMVRGNQLQQAVYVAARLGVADRLADGPRSAERLAADVGAHAPALYRLLRLLAGHGVFREDAGRRFALTPVSELLREGPRSVLPFALWSGGVGYQAFGGLEHSVRTGEPAFEKIFGSEFFDYLDDHPESGEVFDAMMARHTGPIARAVAEFDFSGVETVVDVGGGRGDLLTAVLRRHPRLRGVLVDRPRVLDAARRALDASGVADRCEAVSADILREVPPGDAYILKSVLHGLSDEDAAGVLAACRRAMRPDGVLLIVEFLVTSGGEPSPAKLMDLLMLVGCHGRERTEEEFADLLAASGLRLAGVSAARHGYGLLECRAAGANASGS
ncbi:MULTISPECIES: methyltransferase [Actinomadura]|uniref:Methyltransferase n=2 Tax=Actinomadura yumaensis TaxID=111807 RepID=A0ABW2D2D8_9ACTN|nr:methyltransferase [Actinomadura sp. J1-007]MWK36964.1 methyltransferase domain-containing protein [Actinomadura sp. J1-007]